MLRVKSLKPDVLANNPSQSNEKKLRVKFNSYSRIRFRISFKKRDFNHLKSIFIDLTPLKTF